MTVDPFLTIASFGIGIVVGLTGMGGGALMTPVLVLFFNVPPLTAVSSDLVASAVMKPVGSIVHLRRGTVHLGLVKWLCLGSIPGAFSGVLIARAMGQGQQVQDVVRLALGVALLLAAAGLTVRAYIRLTERARRRDGRADPLPQGRPTVALRILPTVVLGAVGGVVVGLTSVGSGSLIIIALMALYPTLKASELVGTDLVQAVPLVASAALGHILFGDFHMDLTTSLLIGCIPGVWVGRTSRRGLRAAWCVVPWPSCCSRRPSSCSTSPTSRRGSSCSSCCSSRRSSGCSCGGSTVFPPSRASSAVTRSERWTTAHRSYRRGRRGRGSSDAGRMCGIWALLDSNQGPTDYESAALTT